MEALNDLSTFWHLSLQKDSHTLYLEQELESLKVVLDIKNKQLHQQEKKMVELDKLVRAETGHQDKLWFRSEKKQQHWAIFFLFVCLPYQRDKNVKLDESLKKVQQENEDLKARMDRHAALSR